MSLSQSDINHAWDALQTELTAIREDNRVEANNIEYHAQRLINAYVAGLCNQIVQPHWKSAYYRIDNIINDMPVTIRVANHKGYCDTSYKRVHGNTGIQAYDRCIKEELPRYIISIEIIKDKDRRYGCHAYTDAEANITRIELVNVTDEGKLDECLSYIDTEIKEL